VLKTRMALQSTRDAEGNVVGFPIDCMNHNHGQAAGWITDVAQLGGVIQIMPRWNETGRQLIASDTMRYFSPTIDTEAKVIMGGSLTNWPATRTRDHQIMLRPVELSTQLQSLPEMGFGERIELLLNRAVSGFFAKPGQITPPVAESPRTESPTEVTMRFEDLPQEQRDLLLSQARTELASGTPPAELQALIEQRAGVIATERVAHEQRQAHITDLCSRLSGGTEARPLGLPIPADELAGFLTSLTPEAQAKAEGLLSRIVETGLVDFKERGSSRVQQGTAILPTEMAVQLRKWLEHKDNTIAEFFTVNAVELGAMSDYNLSEFIKE